MHLRIQVRQYAWFVVAFISFILGLKSRKSFCALKSTDSFTGISLILYVNPKHVNLLVKKSLLVEPGNPVDRMFTFLIGNVEDAINTNELGNSYCMTHTV